MREVIRHLEWRTRRPEIALLGLWIAFFVIVNTFVQALNKITVPVIDVPLGFYLAVQGSLIVFALLLIRFARR